MSFAIIRNANYKKDNLAGLYKHNERKNTNYSNKDINHQKSINNYSIKYCSTTYSKALSNLIKSNDLKGRIIKTTNVVCEFIITSDKEFFDTIGEEETRRYFQTAYEFVANYQNLGEEYILSAKIHMDESTPHMHLVFVPVIHKKDTKSGKTVNKIACSEYWKGKDSYRRLQDAFYSYITKAGFELERGKTSDREHLSVEKIKELTDYENVKKELEIDFLEIPKNLEKESKALVIAQNKELINYSNNLKSKLLKQYMVVNDYIRTKDENQKLKRENSKFKKEISKLNDYIERSFKIISELFATPLNILKNTVNLIISSDKIKDNKKWQEHLINNEMDLNNHIREKSNNDSEKIK